MLKLETVFCSIVVQRRCRGTVQQGYASCWILGKRWKLLLSETPLPEEQSRTFLALSRMTLPCTLVTRNSSVLHS